MEKLVGAQSSIAIRGASGKLGAIVKQALELSAFEIIPINRETNLDLIEIPLIILDFSGPNPKNEKYWDSFHLNKVLDEYIQFLEWTGNSNSFYIRVGTFGEFNNPLTKYEYVANQISRTVNNFLIASKVNGCVVYPSNIYGRKSLSNFVDVAMAGHLRGEGITLANREKLVNFIHFEDLVEALSGILQTLQSGQNDLPSLALLSPALHSISVLDEYIGRQIVSFNEGRELKQESLGDISIFDSNSFKVNIKILPNRLKNYLDSTIMNALEFDIGVL